MNTFTTLLHEYAAPPRLPQGFVDRVMQRIAFLEERKKLRRLSFAAIITAVCILLLCHSVSLVIVDYLEGNVLEMLNLFSVEPSLLLTTAGWGALLESPFFMHAVFAAIIATGAALFQFSAIRTWSTLPPLTHAS